MIGSRGAGSASLPTCVGAPNSALKQEELLPVTKLIAALGVAAMTVAVAGQAFAHTHMRHRRHGSEVISVSHSIESPRDAHSGLATGRRQHQPVTLSHQGY
jgi:hypothetical protein